MSWKHVPKQHCYTTGIGHGLRREREQGEALVVCGNCGRVEIPLNEREAWNWAVGKGPSITEGNDCPKHKRGWHDWKPAP